MPSFRMVVCEGVLNFVVALNVEWISPVESVILNNSMSVFWCDYMLVVKAKLNFEQRMKEKWMKYD